MAAARKLKAVPPLQPNLADYPYPECREKHDFQPWDGRLDERRKIAYRVQRCPRCTTLKKSQLSMRVSDYGMLIKHPAYVYPKDYRVPGGMDAHDLGQLRMVTFMGEMSRMGKKNG
jgi:hypothetical protein